MITTSHLKNCVVKIISITMQGWSYVGDRLLSAVIPYEESGWYDGQMWVKPPEVSLNSLSHIPLLPKKVNRTKVPLHLRKTIFEV
jgi:hypothetical protein